MDLRFLRTETMIKEKFIEQLLVMPFHDMTVTKLAKISMIDRTTFYIKEQLSDLNIKITNLATGIPVGGEIGFLDEGTLKAAFIDST